jgi:hypothetical protein
MRARLTFIVIALLVVAGFAALNWAEFKHDLPLSFGVFTANLPLGLIMLGLLCLTLLVFLVASATQESRHLLDQRRHSRAMQAQRDLAEKAESSRFTDLRQQIDTHVRESRQRDAVAATQFEKTVMQSQRELRAQMEQMMNSMTGRLAEMEARLTARPQRTEAVPDVPGRDRVRI